MIVELDQNDLREIFGLSSVLEGYSARLAALKHDLKELNHLKKRLDRFYTSLQNGRLQDLPRLDAEFHNYLYSLSGWLKLGKMVGSLRSQTLPFRSTIFARETQAVHHNLDHRRIFFAIQHSDVKKVGEIVKKHILTEEKIILKH